MSLSCYFSAILTPSPVSLFLTAAILMGVKWYLPMFLIYIAVVMKDIEYLFMRLLVICLASLEKCLFRSFALFVNRVFCCCWAADVPLYILDINPVPDIRFENIFFHSVGCPFTLSVMSFDAQTFVILVKSSVFVFLLLTMLLGS